MSRWSIETCQNNYELEMSKEVAYYFGANITKILRMTMVPCSYSCFCPMG
jgi:hypothetical protein